MKSSFSQAFSVFRPNQKSKELNQGLINNVGGTKTKAKKAQRSFEMLLSPSTQLFDALSNESLNHITFYNTLTVYGVPQGSNLYP